MSYLERKEVFKDCILYKISVSVIIVCLLYHPRNSVSFQVEQFVDVLQRIGSFGHNPFIYFLSSPIFSFPLKYAMNTSKSPRLPQTAPFPQLIYSLFASYTFLH